MVWDALRRLFGSPPPSDPGPTTADTSTIYSAKAVIFDPTPAKLAVVGESFYQDTLTALAGTYTERGVANRGHRAALMPEPSNLRDPAAIAVLIEGHVVGYLSRANARSYRPVLDLVATHGLGVGCHASLTGGWDRGSGERATIGVTLHLGSPDQLMAELRSGGVLPAAAFTDDAGPAVPPAEPLDLGDLTGKSVCFTGPSACTVGGISLSRLSQEILATNAGLRVLPRVSRKLDVLVVSPFVDRTGKVARAEQYGILRVDEATFWRTIGVRID